MRSFVSRFAASAAFAIAVLTSFGAAAQPAAEPPVTCAALSAAEPAKVIEACTALIDNPATPDGDRLDATITRAATMASTENHLDRFMRAGCHYFVLNPIGDPEDERAQLEAIASEVIPRAQTVA